MKGEIFIIKFYKQEIFLTNDTPLQLSILNLGEAFNSFKTQAYWKIKILNYNEINFTISTEIISYHTGDTPFSIEQLNYASELEKIKVVFFTKIDTSALCQTYVGVKKDLAIVAPNTNVTPEFNARGYAKQRVIEPFPSVERVIHGANTMAHLRDVEGYTTINLNKTETIEVNLEDVKFGNGFISFSFEKPYLRETIQFKIINTFIKEEFDAIKNYFKNIFQTEYISVEISYIIENGILVESKATSAILETINNSVIESVKLCYLHDLPDRINRLKPTKDFYTKEDLLALLSNSKKDLNIFENDKFFVEAIFEISNTKHFKQLNFLSDKHNYKQRGIQFILKPFAFIFFIEGKENYHLVWETLNTAEATYVWKLNKNLESLNKSIKNIENIIASIKAKTDGKLSYISLNEGNFNRVIHDYSDPGKGFITWKKEMDILLN